MPTGSSPIRVVLVISNLEYGGAQRQVVELANSLDRARFDVHVCSLSPYVPLAEALHDADRRLHVISKRFKFDVTVVTRLARLLRDMQADIVQGYLFDALIAARLAGRLARTPVVLGSERNTDYVIKLRQRIVFRLTRSLVDVIVANSRAGAEYNRRILGHPESAYRVVHNGVNTERFSPGNGTDIRREIGIADDERVVGMFASFKHQKNHPMLIAAARHVLDRVPTARFLLVGDQLHQALQGTDENRRKIEQLAEAAGVRDRIVFLGNRADTARLYRACDVTVLPSFFEGTPNVLLESMACGVPVVATAVSDNAYVVPDGRVGYVVPLGDDRAMADRICRLLTDAAHRDQLGSQARAWVEQEFSTARLAARTAAVFESALAEKRGVARVDHHDRVGSASISRV